MPVDWLIETRKETARGMTETPRMDRPQVDDQKSAANKTRVLRVEYRWEDQYLNIEIQPYVYIYRQE